MIAPAAQPAAGGAADLAQATRDFFRPDGRLERACEGEPFPYEPRPQQLAMAEAVADALVAPCHLAVEAGTGIGKSFAYLVPILLAARQFRQQVVVSTYTIALQEQLVGKDLPFLQAHLGLDFRAVLVKGRSNYLCLRRLRRTQRAQGELLSSRDQDELERVRAWAATTGEGSLQELEPQPAYEVWNSVCAEHGNCLGKKCPERQACFLQRARAQIQEADLLVVNHHLLFSELALRTHGAAFLPPYRRLVLDEAHVMEAVASEHLGLRLSHAAFEHWLRRLYVPESGKGLLAYLKEGVAAQAVTQLWDETARFYGEIRRWADFKPDLAQRVVPAPLELATGLPDLLGRLLALLRETAARLQDEDMAAELRSLRAHGAEMREGLTAFLAQSLEDQVYWVESEGRRRQQTVLYSAPVEVGPVLKTVLFDGLDSVVMTSATLAVGRSLDYFVRRVGLEGGRTLSLGSPFNYARQMRMYIARNMPEPNRTDDFVAAAARAILRFVNRTHGRAFVLFTNAGLMRRVGEQVAVPLQHVGLRLLVQGAGLARRAMLERFVRDAGSVLFGLDSFWMGVDVRGEALSNVIITRLPFAVPDHPVIRARMDRIRDQGGDPFRDFALPEAILKFRQGVGRLIRTAQDEGIVVILDSRIVTRWYGRLFLEAVPECPVEMVEM